MKGESTGTYFSKKLACGVRGKAVEVENGASRPMGARTFSKVNVRKKRGGGNSLRAWRKGYLEFTGGLPYDRPCSAKKMNQGVVLADRAKP